jgi:SAM-dependent methyltransferase
MRRTPRDSRKLADTAARRYAAAGRFAAGYARGKLRHDPVFTAILAEGLIPDGARLIDLGCGQGLLFALLVAAREAVARGEWPAGWPPAPRPASMTGFDAAAHAIASARAALGAHARLERADLRDVSLPAADAIALIDVLHYVDAAAQDAALARCAEALHEGGVLLVRVNDAGAGWRYVLTRIADQLATLLRNRTWPRLHCRRLGAWIAALERAGFEARAQPASAGTPFSNVLLVAQRRRSPRPTVRQP